MQVEPVNKRKYHAFLSHSSKDKVAFVERLYQWFTKFAEIPVWYDKHEIPGGATFATFIAESIPKCRSMIIILSKSAIASGWVEQEYSLALNHAMQYRKFRVIPILIDDSPVPGFLENRTYIKVQENQLDIDFYNDLLQAMYYGDTDIEYDTVQDIYVSRTWHEDEAPFADAICGHFIDRRFRLIGDAEDQPNFQDRKERVRSIVSSCGGLLAILPHRPENEAYGFTSKAILEEISFARALDLPYAVFAERNVVVPDDVHDQAIFFAQSTESTDVSTEASTLSAINSFNDLSLKPRTRHYIFYATSFDDDERNEIVRRTIQRITGMRCFIGDDIQVTTKVSVQAEIADLIRNAFLVIGDVTEQNLNTLIEMGIARGAGIRYHMVATEPRHRPVFMFQDEQIFYFKDAPELLGRIHRLVYPYRRRILNYEL